MGLRSRVRLVEQLQPVRFTVVGICTVVGVVDIEIACFAASLQPLKVIRTDGEGVDRGRSVTGSGRSHLVTCHELIEHLGPGNRIGDDVVLPLDSPVVVGICPVIGDSELVALGILRGDEDDTVVCLRTIDRCGRSILQDGDRLDIARVDIGKASLDTIDEDEGSASSLSDSMGGTTTIGHGCTGQVGMVVGSDIDVTRVAYLTVGLHDVQTGDLALEGTSHVDVGTIGELFSLEVLY